MKKLLLIHPTSRSEAAGFGDTKSWGMPPLALGYIAALTPPDWEIRIVDEYTGRVDESVSADLVGISAYTVNATRAYELAGRFRARGIPVVMGGIHASMMPEEAAQFVDSVVIGEAESVWERVLCDFSAGRLAPVYRGEHLSLDRLPIPRRDLIPDRYEMDVIQTTRGCPFACKFCSVSSFYGARYRHRPVEDVLTELAGLRKDVVYFIDDNFFGCSESDRARALALCDGMIRAKRKRLWVTQASLDIARDPELLRKAFQSGCRSLFVGFESASFASLKEVAKSPNLSFGTPERIRHAVEAIHRAGIGIIGSFIVGFDHDDSSAFRSTYQLAQMADSVQYQILTAFPGTRLFEEMRAGGRLLYQNFPDDWDKCDLDHLMLRPAQIDIVDMVRGMDSLTGKTYAPLSLAWRGWKTFLRTRSPAAALLSYHLNRDSSRVFASQKAHARCCL